MIYSFNTKLAAGRITLDWWISTTLNCFSGARAQFLIPQRLRAIQCAVHVDVTAAERLIPRGHTV